MECGERCSTRTSPCPVPRRRSRTRRRGRLSPSVTAACAGPATACSLISLEEMIHIPCVSTLVRRPSRTLEFTDALTISQRPTSRCGRWHVFCAFARALYDALLCAYAGCGPLRTVQIVEPACSRAPTYARSNCLMLVPRLARLGEAMMRCVLGHALHSMMRALQSIYWGASSFTAIGLCLLRTGTSSGRYSRGAGSWAEATHPSGGR